MQRRGVNARSTPEHTPEEAQALAAPNREDTFLPVRHRGKPKVLNSSDETRLTRAATSAKQERSRSEGSDQAAGLQAGSTETPGSTASTSGMCVLEALAHGLGTGPCPRYPVAKVQRCTSDRNTQSEHNICTHKASAVPVQTLRAQS
jgi:hypothetical protein